jgi:hypothetical protein
MIRMLAAMRPAARGEQSKDFNRLELQRRPAGWNRETTPDLR